MILKILDNVVTDLKLTRYVIAFKKTTRAFLNLVVMVRASAETKKQP